MGAKRTLLNKQGRKQGLLASARQTAPVARAARMQSPHGTPTINRMTRATNVLLAKAAVMEAAERVEAQG